VFSLRLEDITGAFTVEPVLATGSTSVNIRVTNGSLDYENPNQRKFIILVSQLEVFTSLEGIYLSQLVFTDVVG